MKKKELLDMNLGDRMKFYESIYEMEVKPEQHLIVRCDGHKFSKFTKGLKKPFDFILSEAFRLTAQDLLEEFQAYTVYQQSDEITLILPSLMSKDKHKGTNKPQWKHTSNGRVQKLASLVAGFTTMSFNKHFMDLVNENEHDLVSNDIEYYQTLKKKLGNAWFDCRVYGVDSDEEAFNSVMWRVRDCTKNSMSNYALNTLSQYYYENN